MQLDRAPRVFQPLPCMDGQVLLAVASPFRAPLGCSRAKPIIARVGSFSISSPRSVLSLVSLAPRIYAAVELQHHRGASIYRNMLPPTGLRTLRINYIDAQQWSSACVWSKSQ